MPRETTATSATFGSRIGSQIARLSRVLALAALLPAVAGAQMQALKAPSSDQLAKGKAQGQSVNLPPQLAQIQIEQKLGNQVPLDVELTDQDGQAVRLGDYFGERPVLLAPVYFDCPMLCSLVLDGVVRTLKPLSFTPGRELEVVAVSFDPRDTAAKASEARAKALSSYRRQDGDAGFHFLVGAEDQVSRLMAAMGYPYRFDPKTGLYAHSGAVILLTPEGKVSRYFYGVEYPSKDVRLGLVEASQNQIGTFVDQALLFCYHYDPVLGKYSAATLNLIRLGGVLTVLLILCYVGLMLLRERRARRLAGSASSRSGASSARGNTVAAAPPTSLGGR